MNKKKFNEQMTIDRIDKDIDNYIKLIFPGYKDYLEKERAPYIKYLDSLSDFHLFLNYLLDKYNKFFNSVPANAFSLFYAKIGSDVLSVKQCLYFGQLISAVSIERNIFETYVDTMLIIEKDTEKRLVLYSDYEFVQIWLALSEYQNYISELDKKVEKNDKEVQIKKS